VESGTRGLDRLACAGLIRRRPHRAGDPGQSSQRRHPRLSLRAGAQSDLPRPLPGERFAYAEWTKARVHIDYHVEVDGHYYSVPYQLVSQQLDVRVSAKTVECFAKSGRKTGMRNPALGVGGARGMAGGHEGLAKTLEEVCDSRAARDDARTPAVPGAAAKAASGQ
jgi:hypothetical protein